MESYSFKVISTFKESNFVTFNRPKFEVAIKQSKSSISKLILQSSDPFSLFPSCGKGKGPSRDLPLCLSAVKFSCSPEKNKEYLLAGYCNPITVHIALINPVSSMHGVSFPSLLCAQSFLNQLAISVFANVNQDLNSEKTVNKSSYRSGRREDLELGASGLQAIRPR